MSKGTENDPPPAISLTLDVAVAPTMTHPPSAQNDSCGAFVKLPLGASA